MSITNFISKLHSIEELVNVFLLKQPNQLLLCNSSWPVNCTVCFSIDWTSPTISIGHWMTISMTDMIECSFVKLICVLSMASPLANWEF